MNPFFIAALAASPQFALATAVFLLALGVLFEVPAVLWLIFGTCVAIILACISWRALAVYLVLIVAGQFYWAYSQPSGMSNQSTEGR